MTIRGVNIQRIDAPRAVDTNWGTWSYNWKLLGLDQLPFRQQDWPNPVTYSPINYLIGQESYLIQSGPAPFSQLDWPNPTSITWNLNWSQSLVLLNSAPAQVNPFNQKDWPLPTTVNYYRGWEFSYSKELIGRDKLPNRQSDWPNPQPVQWYCDWYQNQASKLLSPFIPKDWQLTPDIRSYRSWEYKYIPELIGQDRLPNNQKDWPLPYPVSWYQDYRLNLLQTTLFVTPAPPFSSSRNYDWPLPQPVTWYQFWSQSPAVPPVPVVVVTTGGRQVGWDEIERVERFSQSFLKDHNAPVPQFYNTNPSDPTIKARDAAIRLGRLGGIASGKARRK